MQGLCPPPAPFVGLSRSAFRCVGERCFFCLAGHGRRPIRRGAELSDLLAEMVVGRIGLSKGPLHCRRVEREVRFTQWIQVRHVLLYMWCNVYPAT